MRKFITIVGVGDRRSGVSAKTNKSYDFTPVYFTYEDQFVSGVKAAMTNVSQDCMCNYTPRVGDSIEVVMHTELSGKVYIDAVL